MSEFEGFGKIARLSRPCTITEKIDGTNAQICITEDGQFLTGSRSRWITPEDDNFGFSKWAHEHKDELMTLGVGRHFGEWWGLGIQRGYGQSVRQFSLFNTSVWWDSMKRPECCGVVPVMYEGAFDSAAINYVLSNLSIHGSHAARGFMEPEGIIIYHHAANLYFKKTLDKDDQWKGKK